MDTAVLPSIECIVALADEHAAAFLDCMHQAKTLAELQAALSGTLLTFLADVARVTADAY